VVAEELTVEAGLAAVFALTTSLAQRALSTEVRTIRRGGDFDTATAAQMTAAPETALRALTVGMVSLAAALVALRW
jgi:hypothetical protein